MNVIEKSIIEKPINPIISLNRKCINDNN